MLIQPYTKAELPPIKVWPEVIDCHHHRQYFSSSHTVVPLWRAECLTVVDHHALLVFHNL